VNKQVVLFALLIVLQLWDLISLSSSVWVLIFLLFEFLNSTNFVVLYPIICCRCYGLFTSRWTLIYSLCATRSWLRSGILSL